MFVRIAILGCLLGLAGCGGEPERSRVVPASATGHDESRAARPAPGEIRKIEMH